MAQLETLDSLNIPVGPTLLPENLPMQTGETAEPTDIHSRTQTLQNLGEQALDGSVGSGPEPKQEFEPDPDPEPVPKKTNEKTKYIDTTFARLQRLFKTDKQVNRAVYRATRNPAHQSAIREDDGISLYFNNAGSFSYPDKDGVIELFKDMEPGIKILEKIDDSNIAELSPEELEVLKKAAIAHEIMAVTNLKLVISIARGYNNRSDKIPFDDLIQYGNFGLFHAISKFDYRRGFRFSTYATWWIRQSIVRGISSQSGMIVVPQGVHNDAETIRKTSLEFIDDNGRSPTIDELEEITCIKKDDIIVAQTYGNYYIASLDAPLNDDGPTTVGDLIGSERGNPDTDDSVNLTAIRDQLKSLHDAAGDITNEDWVLLSMRRGLPLDDFKDLVFERTYGDKTTVISVKQIIEKRPPNGIYSIIKCAEIFGCSTRHISRSEASTMLRLRESANSFDFQELN
jgi:RNA polymerase sigma factor (sigma-70 family)